VRLKREGAGHAQRIPPTIEQRHDDWAPVLLSSLFALLRRLLIAAPPFVLPSSI
jgi:hypothetical protein